jgi:phosphoribosylformylglycinamidine cyclo-ligase
MRKEGLSDSLTYAKVGIDRKTRQKSQTGIQTALRNEAKKYRYGKPLDLPFGKLFPITQSPGHYFDFQIEGVGTKTLLAELSRSYDTIGIDGVAMVVNDILRSGSNPILLNDGIHIARSDPEVLNSLISGVRKGSEIAECTLASGETGDVSEILHNPLAEESLPFDLFVSCFGVVEREHAIKGQIVRGDSVIGLESSGIHSNGITMARRVLLKKWGGLYDLYDKPDGLERPLIRELLEPTRIYAKAIKELRQENIGIKAAVHITGDGLAKFWRLLRIQRHGKSNLGLKLTLSEKPSIFQLVLDAARKKGTPIPVVEMFKTFNMGIGFAIVVSPRDAGRAIDSLNNECRAQNIGFVSSDGKISVKSRFSEDPILL